jgi:hypothetical protein
LQDFLANGLRQISLPREAVQLVIETQGEQIAKELAAVVQRRVEVISEMIVRRVKVKVNRNPREAISATKRVEYLNNEVVDNMPRPEVAGDVVEVEMDIYFFPLKKFTSAADYQKKMAEHGLVPHPYGVAAVNEDDPTFADEHPNGTQWVDKDGKHCYLAFRRWRGAERGAWAAAAVSATGMTTGGSAASASNF